MELASHPLQGPSLWELLQTIAGSPTAGGAHLPVGECLGIVDRGRGEWRKQFARKMAVGPRTLAPFVGTAGFQAGPRRTAVWRPCGRSSTVWM